VRTWPREWAQREFSDDATIFTGNASHRIRWTRTSIDERFRRDPAIGSNFR
jgi:hypothetical protein